jgi:uncharacterized membrane protein YfcA
MLSSITGGTSLLTVPLLLLLGLDPPGAIATNMIVVALLSAGASAKFVAVGRMPWRPALGLSLTAIPGSIVGAFIAIRIDPSLLRLIISGALLGMAMVFGLQPRLGADSRPVSSRTELVGYVAMALWALYGGLFSGGYATVLSLALVFFFGRTLSDGIAASKLVNLVSSAAAGAVFASRHLVRWDVVTWMGLAAIFGGWCGARIALRSAPEQLRRLFAFVLAAIGLKVGYDSLSGRRFEAL